MKIITTRTELILLGWENPSSDQYYTSVKYFSVFFFQLQIIIFIVYNQVLPSPNSPFPAHVCKCFSLSESQPLSHSRVSFTPISGPNHLKKFLHTKLNNRKLLTCEYILSETQLVFHGKIPASRLRYRWSGAHIPEKHRQFVLRLTLSLRRGGVVATPPLSDFPSCRFCVFAKIAIRSIYPPFVQIPIYL